MPKGATMPGKTRAAAGKERRYRRSADEELIALAGEGDTGAFAALYDRHARAAYRLAFRMVGERHAAEDLTQDAFLKIWRSALRYRPERGSVRSWVLAIVANAGVDRLRSRATRRRTGRKAEAEGPKSQPSEAFPEAWRNARRDRVLEALGGIPREQREVLALLHFGGLTQAEVSERLGLPLGTVKGRARLGLRKLRDHPEIRALAVG